MLVGSKLSIRYIVDIEVKVEPGDLSVNTGKDEGIYF